MTIIIQQPKDSNGNPQPMVYDSVSGKIIVDSEGYVLMGQDKPLINVPSRLNYITTPKTQTSGIQEAINYSVVFSPNKKIKLKEGQFNVSTQVNLPGYVTLEGSGLFQTQINAQDTSLTIFKNNLNEGFQTIGNLSFLGSAYRGIDMSNFTNTNNGDNVYIHDIRFNTQYSDCQINMDNNGQSILENIWNTASGSTSTYSLRWNVNGETIRIFNFIDGSTNGMLLSGSLIRMSYCQVNRITFDLSFQTVHIFSYVQGVLNGYAISEPTFAFISASGEDGTIQVFSLESVEWQQGGMTALFDLSQNLGTLYFSYMSLKNVSFNNGNSSVSVAWTNTLPSGGGIGFTGLIPYSLVVDNISFNSWGTLEASSGSPSYQIPPFTQRTTFSGNLFKKLLISSPSVPASGTAQSNTNPYAVKVYVNGGAITEIQITIGSTTYTVYSNSTASAVYESFTLPAGASITLTYTTAPTWSWLPE